MKVFTSCDGVKCESIKRPLPHTIKNTLKYIFKTIIYIFSYKFIMLDNIMPLFLDQHK